MSGGVDSSVSALLLKEAGYNITGVFIKTWHPDFLPCTWKEDREDAMRVCAQLHIPFQTLDLEKEYKKEVVDYMISEYTAGRTPNPDVMCNKHIKFGAFFKYAREQGAQCIATGHYAQVSEDMNATHLLAAVDSNKDQSYFLWTLPQETLKHVLFPIGHIKKDEVRAIARKNDLEVATKKDSQGICFLGHVDLKEFIKQFVSLIPGKVLNENREEIGEHDGALIYTLGQRHGFTVTKKTPNSGPFYVVGKDISHNTITVSERFAEPGIFTVSEISLADVNWIGGIPEEEKEYHVRFRYRQPLQECTVSFNGTRCRLLFKEPQKAVNSGQSAVLYDGDICLGGGIIESMQ